MASNIKVPDFHDCPRAFKGGRFDVRIVPIIGNQGQKLERDVVVYPGSVIILPLIDAQHIVLIRNERFAVGQTLWELPAGTLEPQEDPDTTASRELEEETGYKAASITKINHYFTSPGFCNELMHCYLAKDLTKVGQSLDENEKITVEVLTLSKCLEMIQSGVIADAKTIAAILYYNTFIVEKHGK